MRIVILVLSVGALLVGFLLCLGGGVLLIDADGLLFGLPYLLLMPGVILLALGGFGLFLANRIAPKITP